MSTAPRKGFYGKRKTGQCSNYYVCTFDICPAKTTQESWKPNSNDWNYIDSKNACYSCRLFGTRVDCPARKCTEYDYVTKELRSITLVTIYVNYMCWKMQKIMKWRTFMKAMKIMVQKRWGTKTYWRTSVKTTSKSSGKVQAFAKC